jgi:redox-sensitive bicupin YhaK (pirin superfamily)
MENNIILNIKPLGFLWPVVDPFLFCAHHIDFYPKGNDKLGPDASLDGRDIGQDFTIKDGWRMYHGSTIPGFPVHPHRGFETVTIVREGLVDHSDSHGQAGRYGGGDVQWMTAGSGLQHSEMFPLLNKEQENPAELFQVWLNLPKAKKFAEPYFKMLWHEDIPVHKITDDKGNVTEVNLIAGTFGIVQALKPAPDSWAADQANEVGIWTVKMSPGAKWALPATKESVSRTVYFHRGSTIEAAGQTISVENCLEVKSTEELWIENGELEGHILVLQGKPIGEPVVQYGPFVMNTDEEIRKAFADYRATEFGGWPWPRPDMVHGATKGRFARHRDGSEEYK